MTVDQAMEWLEGEEYKSAQQFQRNGGSVGCDEFARFLSSTSLRAEIFQWAVCHSRTHEEYQDLWRHGWGGVGMAPPFCDECTAWHYARRAMDKLYRSVLLPRKKSELSSLKRKINAPNLIYYNQRGRKAQPKAAASS